MVPNGPLGVALRLGRFTKVMYKPQYLLYGVLWVFALESTAYLLADPYSLGDLRPSWWTLLRVVIVAFVLLYLRMVDEQKDLDYDRAHNPDRPLVTGAVTATDLRVGMAIIAVGAIAASLILSVGSALAIAVVLGYGLLLWGLEAVSRPIKDNILLNLVVTYPVQVLVTAYVLISAVGTAGLTFTYGRVSDDPAEPVGSTAGVRGLIPAGASSFWELMPLAFLFAGAFLQFEFARKTAHEPRPGEHYYSNILGAKGSTAVALAFVALAVGTDLVLLQPWTFAGPRLWLGLSPIALALIPVYGAFRFLRARTGDYPLLPPVLFIVTLYLVLIAQAAVPS